MTAFSQLSLFADLNNQVQIFLAVLAGWMNRKQQKVIDYLLEENRELRLDNQQRRELAKRGKAMGWDQLKRYGAENGVMSLSLQLAVIQHFLRGEMGRY